jgi:hypothetical protein
MAFTDLYCLAYGRTLGIRVYVTGAMMLAAAS